MEKEIKEENITLEETQEQPAYTPRPLWQIAAAWIGLILFLAVVAGFYLIIARGGL